MIIAQSRTRMPALFLVVALIVAALAVGFYLGGSRVDSSGGFSGFSDFDLLTHRGTSSGKSCEPHGKYGNTKPPRASHCDGDPGNP